jgi:hypothetical protein
MTIEISRKRTKCGRWKKIGRVIFQGCGSLPFKKAIAPHGGPYHGICPRWRWIEVSNV